MSDRCPVCDGVGLHRFFNCPEAVREVTERARAERADHGISPAQLREKVEALEKRVRSMSAILDAFMLMLPDDAKAMVVRHENELRQAFEAQVEDSARLDAALKRIEELERHWADLELPMKHFEKANEP